MLLRSLFNKAVKSVLKRMGYQVFRYENYESNQISLGQSNTKTREFWLEKTLKEIPDGSRILDAGAGEKTYKKFCTHLQYVSQDFAKYDGIGDNKGIQTESWDNTGLDIISDITSIPEPDSSFDAILCVEVLEHLPDPISALKEFKRLLKYNGTLIITAPFASLTHFSPYHFYSGFNKYFYQKHLADLGFIINETTPNGNFFEYIAQELQYRIPNKYSDYQISPYEKSALETVLFMLEKMNKVDSGSSELLCFGYHIKAIKAKEL